MSLPLLEYAPNSQNQRVEGFEVAGDEYPRRFSTTKSVSAADMDSVISAAYRQVFHEQQMLKSNRQILLESRLRGGLISVKEFIHGLASSTTFRTWNYDVNNNYRFVELCVQRLLGRNVYDQRERLAWSTVLATKGLNGFIEALVESDEYRENFGDDMVPYQRRRVLPQRSQGDLPFERVPRYGQDYLTTLEDLGYNFSADRNPDRVIWLMPEPVARNIGAAITYAMAGFFSLIAIAVILSWFGWLQL